MKQTYKVHKTQTEQQQQQQKTKQQNWNLLSAENINCFQNVIDIIQWCVLE